MVYLGVECLLARARGAPMRLPPAPGTPLRELQRLLDVNLREQQELQAEQVAEAPGRLQFLCSKRPEHSKTQPKTLEIHSNTTKTV